MNIALNLSLFDFGNQQEVRKCIIPLYADWRLYEERKRELRNRNLSPGEYQNAIQEISEELNL